MKNTIFTLLFILFVFVGGVFAQDEVGFEKYDNYFAKNYPGMKEGTSFHVITDKEQFDKLFGAARSMSRQTFLPGDAFESKFVVAMIKRGGSLRRYSNVAVTSEDGKLIVSYTAKDDAPGSATYNSPLIIAVDNDDYSEVVFIANGKQIGTAKFNN